MEDSLLQNTTLWVAVSFVGFVALMIWKGSGAVKGAIFGRIERIRAEIESRESRDKENKPAAKKAKN